MKKEHDKSYHCDQFGASAPTRDISSLSVPLQSSRVYSPRYLVHNTKQQHKERNSNETFPNYCSISVINMYGWLLCTHSCPGRRLGCRSQMYLLLSCAARAGRVPAPQPLPEQIHCWRERGSADTASAKDRRRSSQPH